MHMSNRVFGLKEDNPSQRNCRNQLRHPSLSHIEQECQESISEISTPPETAVGTHFHARHGTKTIPVFLPAYGEVSWSLLPSSVS